MLSFLLAVVVAVACMWAAMTALEGRYRDWRIWPVLADRASAALGRRRTAPPGRPIEELAHRVRLLGRRHHHPPDGQRFAKAEGVRRAYDAVLAEACTAVGIDHLLLVLPAGEELDAERSRVELALDEAGLELGLPL